MDWIQKTFLCVVVVILVVVGRGMPVVLQPRSIYRWLRLVVPRRRGLNLCFGLVAFSFAQLACAQAENPALDLKNAWVKDRPMIRELVFRRTPHPDGKVSYWFLATDGTNYVVKRAPTEALLRKRVLTTEVDAAGYCAGEFWVATGKSQELRFLREVDERSKETNYINSTKSLNCGVARLGLALLYFGVDPFGIDLAQLQKQLILNENGFELSGKEFVTEVAFKKVSVENARLVYQLTGNVKGRANGENSKYSYKFAIEGEVEPTKSMLPLRYTFFDANGPDNTPSSTVECLSLKLGEPPIPLRVFRPELYVLTGFSMVVRLNGDRLVSLPAAKIERKIVMFGRVFSYKLARWSFVLLVTAITTIVVIYMQKNKKKQNHERNTNPV